MSLYDPIKRQQGHAVRAFKRWFPERQFVMRQEGGEFSALRLTTFGQVCLSFVVVCALSWSLYATWGVSIYHEAVRQHQQDMQDSQALHHALLTKVADHRRTLSKTLIEIERDQGDAVSLVKGEQGAEGGEDAKESRHKYTDLKAGLVALEAKMASLPDRIPPHIIPPEHLNIKLYKAERERDMAVTAREVLHSRVKELEAKLSNMTDSQLVLFKHFSGLASDRADELHSVMAGTGLDIDKLLGRVQNEGQGGPFIPLGSTGDDNKELRRSLVSLNTHVERWNTLQELMKSLPLGSPIKNEWRQSSSFGVRVDPLNGEKAVHQGLDLIAPWRSQIYATGQGRVVHAGWRGRYGRLVEIDHGDGVKTRYAHLAKVAVKAGQFVDRSHVVGLLGNSGRSTGAHLHYEVVVNGVPRNPKRFIRAGLHVFKG